MTTYLPYVCDRCGQFEEIDSKDLSKGKKPLCPKCGALMYPMRWQRTNG